MNGQGNSKSNLANIARWAIVAFCCGVSLAAYADYRAVCLLEGSTICTGTQQACTEAAQQHAFRTGHSVQVREQ